MPLIGRTESSERDELDSGELMMASDCNKVGYRVINMSMIQILIYVKGRGKLIYQNRT